MLQDQEIKNQTEDNTALKEEEDEISLIDLLAVLLKRKWMIIGITLFAAIAVVIVCIISLKLPPEDSFMPNEYTISANMLINDDASSGLSASGRLLPQHQCLV